MNRQSQQLDQPTDRRFTDVEIGDLAHQLMGTCQTIDEALRYDDKRRDENDLTLADHALLDDKVACCNTCSWWDEPSEFDENGDCSGCRSEDNDD